MYSEGICDKLAKFYIEWAWELEQVNSFKKAEQTFNMGLSKIERQEEKEVLEIKHKQFQARVMKRMLEKDDEPEIPQDPEEQRTILSSLKGHGKSQKVGSVRVGAAKISEGPGVLKTSGQLPKTSGNSGKFKIFQVNLILKSH